MSRYDPAWVRSHYDEYGDKEWGRWDVSPVERVKLYVHLHYLLEYLRPTEGIGYGRKEWLDRQRSSSRLCSASH